MKRISITVDEETINLLAGKVNKSEMIRQALKVYNGDISTDTLAGMREAFRKLQQSQQEMEQSINEQLQYVTEMVERVDKRVGEVGGGYA